MIGLLSAFEVAADLDRYFGFVLDLVCAVVVAWCAFQVSKRLRSGNVLCAGVACAWCVAWAGIVAFEELPKALRVNLDFASVFYTAIGGSLSVIPIVFLSRGLLAFRALRAYQQSARNGGDPLAHHPWEEGLYIRKHPRLVNKRSISGRIFILLAPLPYLWVWAASNASDNGDAAYVLGQRTGASGWRFVLLFGESTYIGEPARRQCCLVGSSSRRTTALLCCTFVPSTTIQRSMLRYFNAQNRRKLTIL
jgi:hypothetical protein